MISTIPNWANGMDDVFTWKIVGRGYFGLSGRATTQGAAFFEQFRPCGFMYCTIYATAKENINIYAPDIAGLNEASTSRAMRAA